MKPCTKALYVSLMSRCDSAAIVAKTSELLPEPEMPVKTVSRRFGISTLTFFRLFSRAPCTRMRSCESAACPGSDGIGSSAGLDDPDHVPGRIAEGAVADAVGLVHRLLDHLGAGRLHVVEDAVDVRVEKIQPPAAGPWRAGR